MFIGGLSWQTTVGKSIFSFIVCFILDYEVWDMLQELRLIDQWSMIPAILKPNATKFTGSRMTYLMLVLFQNH